LRAFGFNDQAGSHAASRQPALGKSLDQAGSDSGA